MYVILHRNALEGFLKAGYMKYNDNNSNIFSAINGTTSYSEFRKQSKLAYPKTSVANDILRNATVWNAVVMDFNISSSIS